MGRRVSEGRLWREGGRGALRASGPAKRPKIDDSDFAVLGLHLLEGASAASDEQLVAMLVDRARSEGLQLTGEGGCCSS